jgi:SET and MYND domain-containing protein
MCVGCPACHERSSSADLDPDPDKLSKLREQVYRVAFYLGASNPKMLEAGGEMALGLLMREYGVQGHPELEMMKMISRVSRAGDSPVVRCRLTAQYQINAFTLDSPDLSPLGVSVNPALAMANHSCDPNAVVVFPKGGGLGRIVAIRPIQPEEEVSVGLA